MPRVDLGDFVAWLFDRIERTASAGLVIERPLTLDRAACTLESDWHAYFRFGLKLKASSIERLELVFG